MAEKTLAVLRSPSGAWGARPSILRYILLEIPFEILPSLRRGRERARRLDLIVWGPLGPAHGPDVLGDAHFHWSEQEGLPAVGQGDQGQALCALPWHGRIGGCIRGIGGRPEHTGPVQRAWLVLGLSNA